MATFVLINGATLGGLGFRNVAARSSAAGHEVYTPSLTGLGERAHLASPAVDLETHILDVSTLLCYEDLTGVVLYGASYGGMVITGVADHERDRIAHLVYGDALVPQDGEAAVDLTGALGLAHRARFAAGELFSALPPDVPPWITPHPLKALMQPLRLENGGGPGLPRTFIHATNPPKLAIARSAARVQAGPDWRYRQLPCGHDLARHMPRELVALLIEAAETA